jgi:hypothetical protein
VADEKVTYEVAARFTGEGELRRGASEFDRLAAKAKGSTGALDKINAGVKGYEANWKKYTFAMGAVAGAFVGVGLAAQQAYATLRAGAELQTTTERFGKLAASIGTTADVMLGKLREATKGMISDAELMAASSEIMSLKLADTEEQVLRLATVSGTLGWDMRQVVLTFANLSTMRLDALGLSVDEVKQKQKELMDQGMSTAAAFKEAVIQAGEARLDVGGVSESEQAFKQAEAAVTNFKNAVLESTIATLSQAGAFESLAATANSIQLATDFRAEIGALREEGAITTVEWLKLLNTLSQSGAAAAEVELAGIIMRDSLTDTDDEINQQLGSWQVWARTVAIQTGYAAQTAAANMNAIFTGLLGISNGLGDTSAFLPQADEFDYLAAGARAGKDYRSGLAIEARQARIDQNLQFVRHDPSFIASGREVRNEMEYATAAAYGYSSALGSMTSAEQEAADAHSRFLSSFNQELRAAPEDGLYNAEGVANVEAVNKALYEQVEAAGASAATLALLGVATGQFTQEQAEAALKAAVLQEQIRAIAASVAAGDLSIGDALGQLNQAREALDASNLAAVAGTGEGGVSIAVTADTSTAETNLDGTAAQLDALTSEEYIATVGMDINAVIEGTTEAGRLIGSLPDTKTLTIRWEQSGADVIAALRALGIIV